MREKRVLSHSMEQPTFRQDLEIIKTTDNSGSYQYLVKDPVSGEVFVLGEEEYFLCRQFDGESSLLDVLLRFEEHFNVCMTTEHLEAFITQLKRKGLLMSYTTSEPSVLEFFQIQSAETWKKWKLFNPERFLAWLSRNFWWCYTRTFVAISILIFLTAIGILYNNFFGFLKDLKVLFVPLSLIQVLAVFYLFFNIPAQIAHGMTCIHYGGRADEFCIRLAYNLFPVFYCKSRMWEVREKSARSWILFTPAYFALLMAGLGMLCWKITTPGMSLHTFGIILVVIGTINAIVKLNFLLPMDASHLLANWLEIPDFRRRAQRVARAWLLHRPVPEPLTSMEKRWFRWYGMLAYGMTFLIVIVGGYFLAKVFINRYSGTGSVILFAGLTIMYRKGISEWVKGLPIIGSLLQSRKIYLRLFLFIVFILIMLIPYPYEPGGPFKILTVKHIELRTNVSGEIKKVFVKENDWVKEGDIQGLIDTREHQKNLDVTIAELEKARSDLRLLEKGPKAEEVELAKKQMETAQTKLEYSRKEAERLKELYKEGVVSEEEYQYAAKTADLDAENLKVAKSNLDLVKSGSRPEEIEAQKAVVRDLESRVKYYKENLELTKLLAPISGRVITPYMETKVGQILKEGDLFAVYEDTQVLQAEILIPEADISEIKIGGRIKVRPYTYPTRFFHGQVVLVATDVLETPDGKVVRVLTEIPNDDQELKPGMTGEAKIEGRWKPIIVAFTRPIIRFITVEIWSWFP